MIINRWFSTRLQYLQYVSYGDTAVLRHCNDEQHFEEKYI